MPEQIPAIKAINIGDIVDYNGKSLTAVKEYISGKAFAEGGDKYYMKCHKGVMGFRE